MCLFVSHMKKIKNMENLSELKLYLPRFHINTSNFNPKKLISLINPKVKKLEILCGFTKEKITLSNQNKKNR